MERLAKPDCQTYGWLIDGAPRSKQQVDLFNEKGIIPEKFILLQLEDEVALERITGRRVDPQTSKTYHIKYNEPKDTSVSQRLIQREDDSEEKCKFRLKLYREHFAKADRWYPKEKVVLVDANQQIKDVYQQVVKALK